MERKFEEEELEGALRRAFADNPDGAILFDGHTARNEFLRKGIIYGTERGLIQVCREIRESQYTALEYELSDKGKAYFSSRNYASG